MSDQKWIRFSAITVCVTGILVALYLVGNWLLGLFLPFLLALAVAALARAGAKRLTKHLRMGEKALSVILLCVILGALGVAVYFALSTLLLEMQALLQQLLADSNDPDGTLARLWALIRRFGERFSLEEGGFLSSFVGDPETFFAQQLQNFLSGLSERLPAGVAAFATALPRVLLFLTVTVVACFYTALDYPRMAETVSRLFPASVRQRLPLWRRRIGEAAGHYVRAYLLLFLLTFGELWVGLLLLRVRYAFLLSLLIALLDLLPVLGVGIALVPWGIVVLVGGDLYRGVGLLVLFALITLVRQIAEPHLVGKSLGLHPILMLIAFYTGFRLFGVAGLLVGPILMLLIKGLWQSAAQKEA